MEHEIIQQIEKLKAEREQVKGTPCEVYSRVCGYLRPTQSWNKGKQEEFAQRKMIKIKTIQRAKVYTNF